LNGKKKTSNDTVPYMGHGNEVNFFSDSDLEGRVHKILCS